MEAELIEIREHLSKYPPFDSLDEVLLDEVTHSIEITYYQAGSTIFNYNEPIHNLFYIRSGAVEVFLRDGELFNRLDEGDIFGYQGLLLHRRTRFAFTAIEDTLVYLIPEFLFDRLCDEDENFADFVGQWGSRLKSTVKQSANENDMMVTPIRRLITRLPVMIERSATIQEAAQLMTQEDVSSLLVIGPADHPDSDLVFSDNEGKEWQLIDMVTDQDLRVHILAEGLSAQATLTQIIEDGLYTIQSDESVYEAMLIMLRNNLQSLPVLHRRRPVGLVYLADIVRYETDSSLHLMNSILKQNNVRGLERLKPNIQGTFVRLVDEGHTSQMIGNAMSSIGRSLMRRLIELAEAEMGLPPIPYCYMVHGSLARNDQGVTTDQDNALVLHNSFNPKLHDGYFKELAQRVSDGLDACGYTFCKGGIMATNDKWRQPLSQWQQYFTEWIAKPDAEKLLHSSIFFDLDAIYGEERFVEVLQDLIASHAKSNPNFLAALSRNALNRTPPLGIFRNFVMEKDGKHNNSINMKRRGVAPMNDVIRVHALSVGSSAQNPFERLDDIDKAGVLAPGQVDKIRHALEFMSVVRLRHQAYDIKHNHDADNSIEPEYISDSDRHNLKEAFQILSNAQKFLRFRYPKAGH